MRSSNVLLRRLGGEALPYGFLTAIVTMALLNDTRIASHDALWQLVTQAFQSG